MNAPETNGISVYRIIGIVLAFIIFASVISFSKNLFYVDLSWFKGFNKETSVHKNEDQNRSGPDIVSGKPIDNTSNKAVSDQTWCFVGEDLVGRWCVQVSAPTACPVDRSFSSKNQCEGHKPPAAMVS